MLITRSFASALSEFSAKTRLWGRENLSRVAPALSVFFAVFLMIETASATSRIKDIADFEGIRDNQLVGYGLVVGLNGTGDDLDDSTFTRQSLIGMLERLGVNVRNTNLDIDNVAAVMVTANLPPFQRQGSRMDVTVSALGTAEHLLGGTLLVTPLLGADGEVYAVAQGQVAVGGFVAQGQGATVTKGVPTSGRIPNGGIIEREIGFELNSLQEIKIALRNPDLTTARRVASAINSFLGGGNAARPLDPGTIRLPVPPSYGGDTVSLLTDIEQLQVVPDQPARVVVDEQSGVIVMGQDVRISTVAIAQGNLTIRITETPQVSQPNPFAPAGAATTIVGPDGTLQTAPGGGAVVVPRTEIEIDEGEGNKLGIVDGGVSLQDLVNGLNSLGVGPRDLITILQSIKASGALQAEIEIL